MSAPTEQDTLLVAVGKLLVVWAAYVAGLSLGQWVQLAALAYTVLQIIVLVRDKLWRRQKGE